VEGHRAVTDVERLFADHHATLVHYLVRRLGDRDWAEEVAQETFLRALRHSERAAGEGAAIANERAWLFTVANNLVRDEARKDARRRRHLTLLAAEAREREREMEPAPFETAQERAREQRMARSALEAIAERDRLALLMREEGLDYHEIAEALELSVGSIGTTLARARRRLAEAYEALQRADRTDHAAS
jgi:RNA polymerase sigma-70 factor (ECF subfamily)